MASQAVYYDKDGKRQWGFTLLDQFFPVGFPVEVADEVLNKEIAESIASGLNDQASEKNKEAV